MCEREGGHFLEYGEGRDWQSLLIFCGITSIAHFEVLVYVLKHNGLYMVRLQVRERSFVCHSRTLWLRLQFIFLEMAKCTLGDVLERF